MLLFWRQLLRGTAAHIFGHIGSESETHPEVFDPVATLRTHDVETAGEDHHEDNVCHTETVDFRHGIRGKEVVEPVSKLLSPVGLRLQKQDAGEDRWMDTVIRLSRRKLRMTYPDFLLDLTERRILVHG